MFAGGFTIEGVNILLEKNIYKIVEDAYLATLNKNKKIIWKKYVNYQSIYKNLSNY